MQKKFQLTQKNSQPNSKIFGLQVKKFLIVRIDIPEKPEKVKRLRIKKRKRRKSKPVHKWTQKDIYITKNKNFLPPVTRKPTKSLKNLKTMKNAHTAAKTKKDKVCLR